MGRGAAAAVGGDVPWSDIGIDCLTAGAAVNIRPSYRVDRDEWAGGGGTVGGPYIWAWNGLGDDALETTCTDDS